MALTNPVNANVQGFQSVNTTTGVWSGRTLTAGTGISISNGDGTTGNPTISLTGGGSAIQTITGDTGSVSGLSIAFHATPLSGSSVSFSGSATIMSLNVTDAGNNTIIGLGAGNGTLTGISNTALGRDTLSALTSGSSNTMIGQGAGLSITNATNSTAIGHSALQTFITGDGNTAVGEGALNLATGAGNTAIGRSALLSLTTGTINLAIGLSAGSAYTSSETNNLCIKNAGVIGESNVTRIGSTQTTAFMAGIAGVAVANLNVVTINTSTGQLGSQAASAANVVGPGSSTDRAIATFNGTGGTALFNNSTITIDSTGRLVNTAQPAFEASVATLIADVTGDGTVYPIIFDTEAFDQGSNFNLGTSVFTAPVTGRYQFTFSVGLADLLVGHTAQLIRLTTTLGTYDFCFCNPFTCSAAGGFFSSSGSIIVPMTATNTATLSSFVSGSTKTVDILGNGTTGNPVTTFSGALLF